MTGGQTHGTTEERRTTGLIFAAVIYAGLSNILLYTGDRVYTLTGYADDSAFHTIFNWITVILQPWLWPLYRLLEDVVVPHATLPGAVLTGICSALLLSTVVALTVRWHPKLNRPLSIGFSILAAVAGIGAAIDLARIADLQTDAAIIQTKMPNKAP